MDEINRGGRPRTELTEDQIVEVEKLAAVLNQTQLCDYLGIPTRTFREIMARDEEVSAAYKRGCAKAVGTVAQSLLRSATEGNTTAQIFFLKTRGGWKETAPDPVEAPPTRIELTARQLPDHEHYQADDDNNEAS